MIVVQIIISLHLKNIFKDNELDENSVVEVSSVTASDGKKYNKNFYSLDAIIAVGYRVIQDKIIFQILMELVAKTKKIDKTNISWERQIYGKLAQSIKNKNKKESE